MGNKTAKQLPSTSSKKYNFESLPISSFINNNNFRPSPSFFHSLNTLHSSARAVSIDNFFTPEECNLLIRETENLSYQSLKKEYPEEYRNNERVLVKSEEISNLIWERLHNYEQVLQESWANVQPFGFANEGIWIPCAVNPVIKFNRYKSQKKFLPHIDNMVALTNDLKSIFTIIVYLNDNFEGGETNFYQRPADGKLPFLPSGTTSAQESDEEPKLLFKVKPRQGSILIFNHDVIHSGEMVTGGTKYIIRGEILFHRVTQSASVLGSTTTTEKIKSSIKYTQADKLEEKGQLSEATRVYLKALQLQTSYSSSIRKQRPPSHIEAVPDEILLMLLRFCDFKQLVALSRVNRRWNYYSGESELWKHFYYHSLPPREAPKQQSGTQTDLVDLVSPLLPAEESSSLHAQTTSSPVHYYYLFKNAKLLGQRKQVLILITGRYYNYLQQFHYDDMEFRYPSGKELSHPLQVTGSHPMYKSLIPNTVVHNGHVHYYDSEQVYIGYDALKIQDVHRIHCPPYVDEYFYEHYYHKLAELIKRTKG